LVQAQENATAYRGVFFASVTGNFSVTREKITGAQFGGKQTSIFTLTNGGLSVSYSPDVWGGERRQYESELSQADYQYWQLEAAYLTISSNVVAAAIQEASLRAQIAATNDIIAAQRQQRDLLQKQFELGGVARAAVLAQSSTLDATLATLPGLQKQLAQQRILLTVLVGRFPNQEIAETFDLAGLTLPQDLPLSLPSAVVEQRPDIQAAQAQLHSASAQIGVAIANMLPQFPLSASYGNAVLEFGQFFSGPGIWSIAGG